MAWQLRAEFVRHHTSSWEDAGCSLTHLQQSFLMFPTMYKGAVQTETLKTWRMGGMREHQSTLHAEEGRDLGDLG